MTLYESISEHIFVNNSSFLNFVVEGTHFLEVVCARDLREIAAGVAKAIDLAKMGSYP